MTGRRLLAGLALVLCSAVLLGCLSPGKYDRLRFVYQSEDSLFGRTSVKSSIALGSEVTLQVFGTRLAPPDENQRHNEGPITPRPQSRSGSPFEPVRVDRAQSSWPEVLEVAGLDRSTVQLRGRSPGQSELTVVTPSGMDALDIRVAEVDHAAVEHWLRAIVLKERFAAEAAFIKGGTGRFLLTTYDALGHSLIGYGRPVPLSASPAGAAQISAPAGAVAQVELRFDQVGQVLLTAKGSPPVEVSVIDPGEIEALEILQITGEGGLIPLSKLKVKDAITVVIRGKLRGGRALVLLGRGGAIKSLTPAACAQLPDDEHKVLEGRLGDGIYGVDGVAPGTCTIEASLFGKKVQAEINVEAKAASPPTP